MLEARLDALFDLPRYGPDAGMGRFVPAVYETAGVAWRSYVEARFAERFNGLMLRGGPEVGTVFCSVFPTPDVIDGFLARGSAGDLLLLHHPIDMECGDPRGRWGRAFLPISIHHLDTLRERRLSVYACHAPLDYGRTIGTTAALADALGVRDRLAFVTGAEGSCGVVGSIDPVSTDALEARLMDLLGLPYVDAEGPRYRELRRIAVVAGSGDKVAWMREAEALGAQAYVAGEIHAHIDSDYGRQRYAQVEAYVAETTMSLIGTSHAASEYLVMPAQVAPWLREHARVNVELLPLAQWWH